MARINAIAAVIAAAITAVGGFGVAVRLQDEPGPRGTLGRPPGTATTTTAAPKPRLNFEDPSPEGTDVVSTCRITVHGSGAIPEGTSLSVAVQERDESIIWFEGTVTWKDARRRWEANVSLGTKGSAGNVFTLYAVALESDLAKYLVSTNRVPGDSYWSSPEMPPGSQIAGQVDVRRAVKTIGPCEP